jgi:uncharacterized iron-regulated membrane protein
MNSLGVSIIFIGVSTVAWFSITFIKYQKEKKEAAHFAKVFDVNHAPHMLAYRNYIVHGVPFELDGIKMNYLSARIINKKMCLAWMKHIINKDINFNITVSG